MNYKWLKLNKSVRRIADGACIPNDAGNLDWQRFQAEGGQADPEDLPPAPIDFSDVDNVEKALKALGLVVAAWNGKTPAQLKAAFKTAWDQLP
jgi:hypothetical protein